jgi:hypothetical protein
MAARRRQSLRYRLRWEFTFIDDAVLSVAFSFFGVVF